LDSALNKLSPSDKATPQAGAASSSPNRTVNLALQGGGCHGAFTWGVLDRLLEEPGLGFEGISGTSAGAVNGALLAQGLLSGGPPAARELLHRFWRRVADSQSWAGLGNGWMTGMSGNPHLDHNPIYAGFDLMIRMMSPSQFNPAGFNPLRQILTGLLDFTLLREARDIRLYVSATNVTRGRLRVFSGRELSLECLVASGCLPFLFRAVEIDGEHYWDGGYMGNPTIHPLIHDCAALDVVVVQVTPFVRPDLPGSPTAIVDRINEISFNSTFLRELRAMELINRLIAEGRLSPEECGLKPIRLHRIEALDEMAHLGVSSKLNGDWRFLTRLRDLGRDAAGRWLAEGAEKLGRESGYEAGPFLV